MGPMRNYTLGADNIVTDNDKKSAQVKQSWGNQPARGETTQYRWLF